jgi:hypothetical protein
MTAALLLPRLLERFADRTVMLLAAIVLGLSLLDFALVMSLSNSVPADTDLSSTALC